MFKLTSIFEQYLSKANTSKYVAGFAYFVLQWKYWTFPKGNKIFKTMFHEILLTKLMQIGLLIPSHRLWGNEKSGRVKFREWWYKRDQH